MQVQLALALPRSNEEIFTEIWRDCLAFPMKDLKRAEQNRISKVLRVLGYAATVTRRDDHTVRLWQTIEAPY